MKTSRAACLAFCFVIGLTVMAGCGTKPSGESAGADGSDGASSPKSAIAMIDADDLPNLGEQMPPALDDDRLKISPPQGWAILPKRTGYIVGFKAGEDSYPTITLTVDDFSGVANVSKGTADRFAQQVAEQEKVETVRPVAIGRFVGAIYRKRGKDPRSVTKIVDRLFLATAVGGRLYKYELRDWQGKLKDNQDSLFAVAAGTQFVNLVAEDDLPGDIEELEATDPATDSTTDASDTVDPDITEKPEPKDPVVEQPTVNKPDPVVDNTEPVAEPVTEPAAPPTVPVEKPETDQEKPEKSTDSVDDLLEGLDDLLK